MRSIVAIERGPLPWDLLAFAQYLLEQAGRALADMAAGRLFGKAVIDVS